jgi:hypothetical protein
MMLCHKMSAQKILNKKKEIIEASKPKPASPKRQRGGEPHPPSDLHLGSTIESMGAAWIQVPSHVSIRFGSPSEGAQAMIRWCSVLVGLYVCF